MSLKREFRQRNKLGKVRRWVIELSSNTYSMSDGEVGGKMKEPTTHVCEAKNIGRTNEVPPVVQAMREAERQIELKMRAGYREVDIGTGICLDGEELPEVDAIDFDDPPTSTRHYKMPNSMTAPTIKAIEDLVAWFVRKRDGNRIEVVFNSGGRAFMVTSAYLRHHPKDLDEEGNPIPYLARFPHIERALYEVGVPPQSILLCELVTVAASGYSDKQGFDVDDLDLVDAVRGGKTDHGIEIQKQRGALGLCIWDWAWKGGECLLQTTPFYERMNMIKTQIVDLDESGWLTFPEIATIYPDPETGELTLEVTSPNLAEPLELELDDEVNDILSEMEKSKELGELLYQAVSRMLLSFAQNLGWEGWVVHDPHAVLDENAWNLRSKWYRPTSCAKLKPEYPVDVIARYDPDNGIGVKGKGAKKVGLGSAECFLIDPRTGKEVSVGNCGNGFSKEKVLEYGDPALYPMVWKVVTSGWTKEGKLWHARFVGEHKDKTAADCTIDQNPRWEDAYASEG